MAYCIKCIASTFNTKSMLIHNDIFMIDNKAYTLIKALSFTLTLRHNQMPAIHKMRHRANNMMSLYLTLECGKNSLAKKPPICSCGRTTSK